MRPRPALLVLVASPAAAVLAVMLLLLCGGGGGAVVVAQMYATGPLKALGGHTQKEISSPPPPASSLHVLMQLTVVSVVVKRHDFDVRVISADNRPQVVADEPRLLGRFSSGRSGAMWQRTVPPRHRGKGHQRGGGSKTTRQGDTKVPGATELAMYWIFATLTRSTGTAIHDAPSTRPHK